MQITANATLYILALPFWVCVCVWGGQLNTCPAEGQGSVFFYIHRCLPRSDKDEVNYPLLVLWGKLSPAGRLGGSLAGFETSTPTFDRGSNDNLGRPVLSDLKLLDKGVQTKNHFQITRTSGIIDKLPSCLHFFKIFSMDHSCHKEGKNHGQKFHQ